MPCYDSRDAESVKTENPRVTELTRILCDSCKWLLERDLPIPDPAADWWDKHKLADKAREEQEIKEAKEKINADPVLKRYFEVLAKRKKSS